MTECRLCGCRLSRDPTGAFLDDSGGEICDVAGTNEPHQVVEEGDELTGIAILDVTGVTDGVPGMPDVM